MNAPTGPAARAATLAGGLWLVGYAVFLAGAMLEVLSHNVGVALSIPGGLFEIAFGVLLIAKGFPAGAKPRPSGTGPQLAACCAFTLSNAAQRLRK